MTTASNRAFWSVALNRAVGKRPWIAVVLPAAWLLLSGAVGLLAARAWTLPSLPTNDRTVFPGPKPGEAARRPVPAQRGSAVIDLRESGRRIPRQAGDRPYRG
jgi:hypothetical protein